MSTPPPTETPAPRRRRPHGALRAIGIVATVIAGAAIIAYLVDRMVSSDRFATDFSSLLNRRVVVRGTTRVRVDRVERWRGNRAQVRGMHLEYQVDGAWREAFRARHATVTLQRIPVGSRWQIAARLDSVDAVFYQSADGRWRAPEFGGLTKKKSETRVLLDAVVTHGSVRLVRRDGSLASTLTSIALGVHMDSRGRLDADETGTEIALRNAQFLSNGVGPYTLDGRVVRGKRTRFDGVQVDGPGLALRLAGEMPPSSEGGGARGALIIDTRGPLARAIGYPVPALRTNGALALLGTAASPVVLYRGHGEYRDVRVDTLAVRVRRAGKQRFLLESAFASMGKDLRLAGARGELDLERRRLAFEVVGGGRLDLLPGSLVGGRKMPNGHVQGRASFRGRMAGPYDVTLRLGRSDVQGVAVTSTAVDGRVSRDRIDITRSLFVLPGASVNGAGTISLRARTSDVPFAAVITDLGALGRNFGITGLGGSGAINGRLTGNPAAPLITARGALANPAFADAHASVARIDSFALAWGPRPTMGARLSAENAYAGTMSLGAAHATVQSVGGRTVAHFVAERDDGSLRVAGQSETVRGTTRLLLDEARTRVGEDTWTLRGPAALQIQGGRTTIQDAVATSDLGGRVILRSASIGPGDALLVHAALDSVLVGSPVADQATFWRGRVRGDVDVQGSRRAPRITAHVVAVVDTASRNVPIRTASFTLRAAGGSAQVTDIDVRDRDGGMISGQADLRYAGGAAERLFRRDWDALDAVSLSGTLRMDSVAVAPWTQRPAGGRAAVAGNIEGTARLAGTLGRPDVDARVTARGVGSEAVRSDSVVATVRLRSREGKLFLDNVAMHGQGTQAIAKGVVPLHIRLPETFELASAGLDIQVDAPTWDLRLVPGFLPAIGSAAGAGSAQVSLSGDPHDPLVAGQARVRGATIRLAGRAEVFTDVEADARLANRGLTITRLTARQNPRGQLTGTGNLTWSGRTFDYALHLDASDVAIVQPGFFAARVTGKFDVVPGPGAPSPFVALIRGTGTVPEAVVTYEFRQEGDPRAVSNTPGQALQIPNPPILLDLTLHADRDVWLKNRDSDIEMSGDLRIVLPASGVVGVRGEITLIRGRYTFLDTGFRIVRGRILFNDISTLNPTIDVVAEANVRSTTGAPEVIQLTFSGTQTEPVIRGSSVSNPGRPSNAVLAGLAENKFTTNNQVSGEAATAFGTNVLVRQFERQFIRQTGLVDVFSVGAENRSLTVGKYLFSELYVRYAQSSGTGNVAIEYWMNRNVYLTGEYNLAGVASQGGASPTIPTESPAYRIGIKVRHEF